MTIKSGKLQFASLEISNIFNTKRKSKRQLFSELRLPLSRPFAGGSAQGSPGWNCRSGSSGGERGLPLPFGGLGLRSDEEADSDEVGVV